MATKTEEKRDKLIKEYQKLYSLKLLQDGIDEIKQDKILEEYYNMKYVRRLNYE